MADQFLGQQIGVGIIRLHGRDGTAQPYVLPISVIGIETDTGAFKIGDGSTAWASLPYGPIESQEKR